VHRLLDPDRAGPAGAATLEVAGHLHSSAFWGSISVALAALALALGVPPRATEGIAHRTRALLVRPSSGAFAAFLGITATGLGMAAVIGVHRRLPRLIDEMAQLLHARAFASGDLALPTPVPAGRVILNGVLTPEGWASVYPPGHTALLALGHLAGTPWLVGPVLLGVTAAFASLALDLLVPERPGTARAAGLGVATSPFLLLLGSGYLSHVSVAAASSLALYFSVRAWRDGAAWALPAGAAAGFAVTARPWSGLVLGAFLTAGVWAAAWWREGRSISWLLRRGLASTLGALPFGLALLTYDARLFGAPFRLGYQIAFGPEHGLGFHPDPWGNLYGVREAVGYTAADLVALGTHLFETPLPACAVVGLFLLFAPRLSLATRILAAWALLGVAANAAYWHHGYHLGPRMLGEAAPGWAALTVIAAAGLLDGGRDPLEPVRPSGLRGRALPSRVFGWMLALAVSASLLSYVPSRLRSYGWRPAELTATALPDSPATGPSLVFVHGTWAGRVAARLEATGMRRDSVETALRRNGLCRVHGYAAWRAAGAGGSPPPLELEALPGSPPHLLTARIGGVPVRLENAPRPAACAREIRADRLGVVEIAPLLWQTALPGSSGGTLVYRDLGPAENSEVMALHPDRTPWVYVPRALGEAPQLVPFDEGMARIWGEGAAARPGPDGLNPAGRGG
jgi:hypothetical protein